MRPPLEVAVQALAGICDGARALDDMGYNATDTRFGKFLSSVPYETWTPKMKYAGWMMLHKYTGQLARAGIDYNTIPVPPHPDTVPPPKPPPEAPKRITREGPVRYRLEFPYKAAHVALVKDIPGRRFERQDKYWTVPKSPEAAALIQALAEEGFQVEEGILDELRATQTDAQALLVESRAEDAELHIDGLGGTLRPFQRAGVRYALKSRRCFIADQMGLGKTIEALATVHAAEAFPAVVVCPATLKLNWRRETKKWLPGRRVRVLSGGKGLGLARSAVDVTILNYDILGKRMAELLKIEPKAVIFDESHYAKNGKAKRTKAARALAAGVDMRLCLTGTPITNRPVEWAAQLEILDRLDELGGYWQFVHRYCSAFKGKWGWDFSGSCNLDELNTRIRALCYIRRNKSDVLKELPPKIRAIVPVELDNRAEYNRARADVVRFLADKAAKNRDFLASIEDLDEEERKRRIRARMEDAAYRAESAKQLVEIEALKQVAVRGKMKAICEWVEDFLESGEKLVIFAHHRDIQRELMDWLPQHNPAQVIGGQRDIDKQENIDRFQDDDACRLIVCSLMAGGVGITLTAASNVLFVELGWNPAQHDQAEDRCHRIGQEDNVTVWYILAENTIDMVIHKLIEQKREVVDAATEGGPLETQTGILNALIEELIQEGT